MKKVIALDVIVFLFMFLFLYAAVSKLLAFEMFRAQLGKSPLITRFAGIISWAVPAVEVVVAALLFIPKFRLAGLYGAFTLMFGFTAYIAFILVFSPYVPCSCGGILNSLGWVEHLGFNVVFTGLAVVGVVLYMKTVEARAVVLNTVKRI